MIITTLIVCFLLAFLPLVISAFSYRYVANVFSKSILSLSAASFLLGLAQFGLILGLSYELFDAAQMEQAPLALQYISIAGGAIMIIAGFFWVGYFRLLIKSKSPAKQAVRPVETQPVPETSPYPASRKRREKPEPDEDLFSGEAPQARLFQLAAVVSPKDASAQKPTARNGRAKTKS